MSILVDTNILVRRLQPNHPLYMLARRSIPRLIASGTVPIISPQNLIELWNVATRPVKNNGLGFEHVIALAELNALEKTLQLLPDHPAVFPVWKNLVLQHSVTGSKVHDAKLAAFMQVYRIDRILTFDARDFARFGVQIVDPASL